ncbi:unnamed protein product [Amoebophrya sp. A120]|nr:unnamed protein product [Amoebophrya sp. A120]|eukprot:GSA120T00021707001.1
MVSRSYQTRKKLLPRSRRFSKRINPVRSDSAVRSQKRRKLPPTGFASGATSSWNRWHSMHSRWLTKPRGSGLAPVAKNALTCLTMTTKTIINHVREEQQALFLLFTTERNQNLAPLSRRKAKATTPRCATTCIYLYHERAAIIDVLLWHMLDKRC